MITDVSEWEINEDIWTTGTRVKNWLKHPTSEVYWLFKEPKSKGEMYAELASYKIGTDVFLLDIAEIELAICSGIEGTICKSFLGEENSSLFEAVDYFGAQFDENDLLMYTIESAIQIAKNFGLEKEFISMCIFDYLIANQDRHCGNWGFIETPNEPDIKKMAPLYDNGSSLFNGLSDEKIEQIINDEESFRAFTNRAKSIFTVEGKKKPKCTKLLEFLINYDKLLFEECFGRFSECSCDTIYRSISFIPLEIMNDKRKILISRLVLYRISLINDLLERGEELC